MNHIFKLKFSNKQKELIVVSELATNSVASKDATPSQTQGTSSSELKAPSNLRISPISLLTASLVSASLGLASLAGTIAPAQAANLIYGPSQSLGTVAAGQVTSHTTQIGDSLVTAITNSPNAIVNWQSLNLKKSEVLEFIQQNAHSAVLNRVLGNQVSQILGTLRSNGQVFIINPNGVVFGKDSKVDVAGLVASSLNITDKDFTKGRYIFNQEKDQALAQVINQGMITVNSDGSIALIGGQVVNQGVLRAKNGSVMLLAGNSIQIADLNNPLISYKVTATNKAVNLGQIFAHQAALVGSKVLNGYTDSNIFADIAGANQVSQPVQASIKADGSILLYGASQADQLQSTAQTDAQVLGERNSVVVNNGTLDASVISGSAAQKAGTIKVLGGLVVADKDSKILAQGLDAADSADNAAPVTGGTVYLGGDTEGKGSVQLARGLFTDKDSSVDVSATKGNAGHIYLWGDLAKFAGTYKANSVEGDGGLIETSVKGTGCFTDSQSLTIQAYTKNPLAKNGQWIIDPTALVLTSNVDSISNDAGRPSEGYTKIKEIIGADGSSDLEIDGKSSFSSWSDVLTLLDKEHPESGDNKITVLNSSEVRKQFFKYIDNGASTSPGKTEKTPDNIKNSVLSEDEEAEKTIDPENNRFTITFKAKENIIAYDVGKTLDYSTSSDTAVSSTPSESAPNLVFQTTSEPGDNNTNYRRGIYIFKAQIAGRTGADTYLRFDTKGAVYTQSSRFQSIPKIQVGHYDPETKTLSPAESFYSDYSYFYVSQKTEIKTTKDITFTKKDNTERPDGVSSDFLIVNFFQDPDFQAGGKLSVDNTHAFNLKSGKIKAQDIEFKNNYLEIRGRKRSSLKLDGTTLEADNKISFKEEDDLRTPGYFNNVKATAKNIDLDRVNLDGTNTFTSTDTETQEPGVQLKPINAGTKLIIESASNVSITKDSGFSNAEIHAKKEININVKNDDQDEITLDHIKATSDTSSVLISTKGTGEAQNSLALTNSDLSAGTNNDAKVSIDGIQVKLDGTHLDSKGGGFQ